MSPVARASAYAGPPLAAVAPRADDLARAPPQPFDDLARPVGGAVVDDDDLLVDGQRHGSPRGAGAEDRVLFVVDGNQDTEGLGHRAAIIGFPAASPRSVVPKAQTQQEQGRELLVLERGLGHRS